MRVASSPILQGSLRDSRKTEDPESVELGIGCHFRPPFPPKSATESQNLPRGAVHRYLGHWLNVLKEDKRAIFSAAAYAQRAADYLHGLQRQQETAAA